MCPTYASEGWKQLCSGLALICYSLFKKHWCHRQEKRMVNMRAPQTISWTSKFECLLAPDNLTVWQPCSRSHMGKSKLTDSGSWHVSLGVEQRKQSWSVGTSFCGLSLPLVREGNAVSRIKITQGPANWPQWWYKDKAYGGPFSSPNS